MPVEPMYIPGRLRTASRPSRTVMSSASYVPFARFSGSCGSFAMSLHDVKKPLAEVARTRRGALSSG